MILLEHSVGILCVSMWVCEHVCVKRVVVGKRACFGLWNGFLYLKSVLCISCFLFYWLHLVFCFVNVALCPSRFLDILILKMFFFLWIGLYFIYISHYFFVGSKLMVKLIYEFSYVSFFAIPYKLKISLLVATKIVLGFW